MNDEILNRLHKIASVLEENGKEVLANEIHDVFLRLSAKKKKKKSSGKNVPNNPSLWASKAQAKAKFDVYPSAYANGWAAKQYKSKGGTWRKSE